MESPTPFGLHDLIEAAVAHLDDDDETPPDRDEMPTGWWAIGRLHGMATRETRETRETLDAAMALCRSADPKRRRVGAGVLGQLGHISPGYTPVFLEERFQALDALLAAEMASDGDVDVLGDTCIALGHLHDARAIERVAALRDHPDATVRYDVVHGLSAYEDERAIDSLIGLSADAHDDVRDWATFGLGSMIRTDTPEIRAALHARLDDANLDVRGEAMVGLAERHDESVLPCLVRDLDRCVSSPLFDAAAKLADPKLCDALRAVKIDTLTWVDAKGMAIDLRSDWEAAMNACGCVPEQCQAALPPNSVRS